MNIDKILDRNFTKISDEYRSFAEEKTQCRDCSIYGHYQNVVMSEGNALDPTFMIIGEACGKDEIVEGRPFIGKSGRKIRQELRNHRGTFNKQTCVLSNILPCRPLNDTFPHGKRKWGSDNEVVSGEKMADNCIKKWLIKEIGLLRPKVLILLGDQPLKYVAGKTGITDNRGSWDFIQSLRAWSFATYHPSYVMQCEHSDDKKFVIKQFVEDIEKIAKTWRDIVLNDSRMSMSPKEWTLEKGLISAIDKKIIRDRPI